MITETYLRDEVKSTVLWGIGRTVAMWSAMKISGQNDQTWKRAIAGAISVQAFVSGWMLISKQTGAKLPSDVAVEGKDPIAMIATTTARAVIIGGGMYVAGFRKGVVKDALVGALIIEAGVIASSLYLENKFLKGGS